MKCLEESLEEDILSELQCPVCLNYMLPPIRFCENGHNICNDCRSMLDKCPSCQNAFLSSRNMSLERLATKMEFPCCYKKLGCVQKFSTEDLTKHQNACRHRPYRCPFYRNPNLFCEWMGFFTDMLYHIRNVHSEMAYNVASKRKVMKKEFRAEQLYEKILFVDENIFREQFQVKGNDFYFIVQHINPGEKKLNFYYDFTLTMKEGNGRIAVRQDVASSDEDIEIIKAEGKCVRLHFDVVRHFMEEGDMLVFELEISKAV